MLSLYIISEKMNQKGMPSVFTVSYVIINVSENVLFVLYNCCWMLYTEMINMNLWKKNTVYTVLLVKHNRKKSAIVKSNLCV